MHATTTLRTKMPCTITMFVTILANVVAIEFMTYSQGVPVVLSLFMPDPLNPYLRGEMIAEQFHSAIFSHDARFIEWAVVAVRNLTANNDRNQRAFAIMHNDKPVITAEELEAAGLEVQIDSSTGRLRPKTLSAEK